MLCHPECSPVHRGCGRTGGESRLPWAPHQAGWAGREALPPWSLRVPEGGISHFHVVTSPRVLGWRRAAPPQGRVWRAEDLDPRPRRGARLGSGVQAQPGELCFMKPLLVLQMFLCLVCGPTPDIWDSWSAEGETPRPGEEPGSGQVTCATGSQNPRGQGPPRGQASQSVLSPRTCLGLEGNGMQGGRLCWGPRERPCH